MPSFDLQDAGYAQTATLSNVASSASSVTLVAANTKRKALVFWNDSTAVLYVTLDGTAASTSNYTIQIAAQGTERFADLPVFQGKITGIWAAANGNLRVTELS